MRRAVLILVALLWPLAVSAQDAIDLHQVQVFESPNPADWPITATLTALDLGASDCAVEFTQKDAWPDVEIPGWNGGKIQYTLWMVVNVNGQWMSAGGIEFWKGRIGGCGPAGQYAQNWYFFNPISQHQPAQGERVGFLVTAGDQRRKDVRAITARSNVVAVDFPGPGGGSFRFDTPAPPVVNPPPPIVVTPPAPPSPPPPAQSMDLSTVLAKLDQCLAGIQQVDGHVEAGRAENRAFIEAVRDNWKKIVAYVAPIIGALVAGRATAP